MSSSMDAEPDCRAPQMQPAQRKSAHMVVACPGCNGGGSVGTVDPKQARKFAESSATVLCADFHNEWTSGEAAEARALSLALLLGIDWDSAIGNGR